MQTPATGALVVPAAGSPQTPASLAAQYKVSPAQMASLATFVRAKSSGSTSSGSLTNAFIQVRVNLGSKAASAGAGSSSSWLGATMGAIRNSPAEVNLLAARSVRTVMSQAIELVAINDNIKTPSGLRLALVDAGVQGGVLATTEACSGANGCSASRRQLQGVGQAGTIALLFNATYSPDAVEAASNGQVTSDMINYLLLNALNKDILHSALRVAAAQSSSSALKAAIMGSAVLAVRADPPVMFNMPITGWNLPSASLAPSESPTLTPTHRPSRPPTLGPSLTLSVPTTPLPTDQPTRQPTHRPSFKPSARPTTSSPTTSPPSPSPSVYYVPCTSNCPRGVVPPLCSFYQSCGNGCFCGTFPLVPPSNQPTQVPSVNTFFTVTSTPKRSGSARLRKGAPTFPAATTRPSARAPAAAPALRSPTPTAAVKLTASAPSAQPAAQPTVQPSTARPSTPRQTDAPTSGPGVVQAAAGAARAASSNTPMITGVAVGCAVLVAVLAAACMCGGRARKAGGHEVGARLELALQSVHKERASMQSVGRQSLARQSLGGFDHHQVYGQRPSFQSSTTTPFTPYIASHHDESLSIRGSQSSRAPKTNPKRLSIV